MPDALDLLGKVSGLPRTEMLALAEQVRENVRKLDSCPWHDFEPIPGAPSPMRQRYRCRHCGGEINASAYRWHERGRRPRPDA